MSSVGLPPPQEEVAAIAAQHPEAAALVRDAEGANLRVTPAAGSGLYGLSPGEPHLANVPLDELAVLWGGVARPVVSELDAGRLDMAADCVGLAIDAIPLAKVLTERPDLGFAETVAAIGRGAGLLARVPGISHIPVMGQVQPMLAVVSLVVRTVTGVHELIHEVRDAEDVRREGEKLVSVGVAGLELAARFMTALQGGNGQAIAESANMYLETFQSQRQWDGLTALTALFSGGADVEQYRPIE
jgi:hypothetical protein